MMIESTIPRVAHFVWIGEIPDWLPKIIEEFRRHNPEWETLLHREPPPGMPAGLRAAVADCWQRCQIADVIYCWILATTGGVVMDTDSVTLRSFEPLRFAGPAWTTWHSSHVRRLTNGVMGAVPESRAFVRMCESIAAKAAEGRRPRRCEYGPDGLTEMFGELGDEDLRILPWHYFYPFPFNERSRAAALWRADDEERREMIGSIRHRYSDGKDPYAVHLWGIDGSSQRGV